MVRPRRADGRPEIKIVPSFPLRCCLMTLLIAAGALPAAPASAQTPPAPASPPIPAPAGAYDGVWVGRAQGGDCKPLDVRITVESGLLDGVATEPDNGPMRVQGKKGEQLPVPPALWQLNGKVGGNGAVDIIGLRSMKDRDRQRSRWSGRAGAGALNIAETDGPCRRSATLSRGR
jgi:hypothetical protein